MEPVIDSQKKETETQTAGKVLRPLDTAQPEELRDYIHQLRSENKKLRIQSGEALSNAEKKAKELEEIQKKALEEQGKYKELYESAVKEIEVKKQIESRLKGIEENFTAQYEIELKDMTEEEIKLLEELPAMPIEKKIEWAKKIKGKKSISQNSVASERPASGTINSDDVVKQYQSGNLAQKSELLFAMKATNKKIYDMLKQL